MKKNMIALIAGAAALCIMAAGCGSQTTGTAGSAAASTASTADAAATTAAAEETPAWQEDDTAYLSGIKASDYVELPDGYKHQEVEVAKPVDPTDEEVEDRMNLLVKNNGGALEEVSRSVQKGDTVSIDYVGKIDGKEFEGGTGSYDLQIGSGAFIEGFEDGLIGAKKGETLDLNLKFPDDYPAEDVAGKDVVEVYFTPPYTNGGIEKASVNLVDFGKTGVLAAGASETLSFSIPVEDLASYDSDGIKVAGGGYILEAGEYTVSVRSDSHTVKASESFTVDADIDYSKEGRSTDKQVAVNHFQDYSRGNFVQLSRADGFANYEEATAAPSAEQLTMSAEVRAAVEKNAVGIYDPTLYDNADDVMPTLEAKNGLKLADLTGKSYDDPQWEKLLDQLSFNDMATMINIGGWRTVEVESVGKVATSDCDGPAGLSNFITGAYGTAYPSEVLMAQTWNTALIEEMGTCMGQEYQDAKNFGWYGPAMNTHRNAFAGRNFEYFSEDGVLAGKLASAEINGACTKGVYPYIKHFALNDQEGNRCSFLLTFASEQAIREIYLKPFETAVKNYKGTPLAVMSAFNWIGTLPCCANPNLLNTVLRGEWGFVGMVETDYDGSYGYMISDHCVRSGNDLMLGFASAASNQFTDNSATATLAMRQSSKNILYTIGNSGYYTLSTDNGGMSNMDRLFLIVDVCIGVAILALLAIVFLRYFNKKKKAKKAA